MWVGNNANYHQDRCFDCEQGAILGRATLSGHLPFWRCWGMTTCCLPLLIVYNCFGTNWEIPARAKFFPPVWESGRRLVADFPPVSNPAGWLVGYFPRLIRRFDWLLISPASLPSPHRLLATKRLIAYLNLDPYWRCSWHYYLELYAGQVLLMWTRTGANYNCVDILYTISVNI